MARLKKENIKETGKEFLKLLAKVVVAAAVAYLFQFGLHIGGASIDAVKNYALACGASFLAIEAAYMIAKAVGVSFSIRKSTKRLEEKYAAYKKQLEKEKEEEINNVKEDATKEVKKIKDNANTKIAELEKTSNKTISGLEDENILLKGEMGKLKKYFPEAFDGDRVKNSSELNELSDNIKSNEKKSEKEIKKIEDNANARIAELEKTSNKKIKDLEEENNLLNGEMKKIRKYFPEAFDEDRVKNSSELNELRDKINSNEKNSKDSSRLKEIQKEADGLGNSAAKNLENIINCQSTIDKINKNEKLTDKEIKAINTMFAEAKDLSEAAEGLYKNINK